MMKESLEIYGVEKKDFVDSYRVNVTLKDENGELRHEIYRDMSLADFEVLYGTFSDEIVILLLTKEVL